MIFSARNWEKLSHAYGSAEDVPILLSNLESDEIEVQKNAIQELHNCILHQGTIYEATAPAILYLIEIVEGNKCLIKEDVLLFISTTLEGTTYRLSHTEIDQLEQYEIDEDNEIIESIYKNVASGYETYIKLSTKKEHNFKLAVFYILSKLHSKFDDSIPLLLSEFKNSKDENIKNYILSCISKLCIKKEVLLNVFSDFIDSSDKTRKIICAFTIMAFKLEDTNDEILKELITYLIEDEELTGFPDKYEYFVDKYTYDIIDELTKIGKEKMKPHIEYLLTNLEKINKHDLDSIVAFILDVVFQKNEEQSLDAIGITVLNKISKINSFWESNNMYSFIPYLLKKNYGLPNKKNEILQLIKESKIQ